MRHNSSDTKIYISGLGTCLAYDWKLVSGGIYVWLYCKDCITKMPEPVFVTHGQYVIRDEKKTSDLPLTRN